MSEKMFKKAKKKLQKIESDVPIEDNFIRFNFEKYIAEHAETIEVSEVQSDRAKQIIDKLVLLALPSPSQHNH